MTGSKLRDCMIANMLLMVLLITVWSHVASPSCRVVLYQRHLFRLVLTLVFTAMMLAIWALHNLTIDSLIGMVIAASIGGLLLGWWKRTHNVHHIVTNALEYDLDN